MRSIRNILGPILDTIIAMSIALLLLVGSSFGIILLGILVILFGLYTDSKFKTGWFSLHSSDVDSKSK